MTIFGCSTTAVKMLKAFAQCVSVVTLCFLHATTAAAQVNAERMVSIGCNALYFDDYVVAIQYFNRAIAAKPYLAKPYFYRSLAKLNLEDFRGAEADATKAVQLNPFLTDAWEVRGVARQNLGNNAGAVDDYARALDLLPHNRQISANMGAALTDLKRYDEADSVYNGLLVHFPGYENAHLGLARLNVARADTAAAVKNLQKTLQINPNSFNACAMRADIALRTDDLDSARTYLDRAIKLQPKYPGLYVNRAFLRYRANDWFGAMADYDYAIDLDPADVMAHFNRGLLEMEVQAVDKALDDFNHVLAAQPDDARALFNRALIHAQKHMYARAVDDISGVIEQNPDYATAYGLRSDFLRAMGKRAEAMRDHDRANALIAALGNKPSDPAGNVQKQPDANESQTGKKPDDSMPDESSRRRFATLLTVEDNTDRRTEYNNSGIRGRVQDRNIAIRPENDFVLTYYASPDEVNPDVTFIKEVDDLNATRALRFVVMVANRVPRMADDDIADKHFKSIEYYNSYLATHSGRAIDFIGRALDFMTLRNYESAIADLDRAIALTPSFSAAYMLRAQARAMQLEAENPGWENNLAPSASGKGAQVMAMTDKVMADLKDAIALSPRNPYLWYNLGNLYLKRNQADDAIEAYNHAIALKPEMGQAWYNRGYVHFKTGNRNDGINDLSKAGELGIVQAYNLIKRMDI